jgi:signal peptidase I
VVNFDFPGNRDEIEPSQKVQYLKRLVGEPGDTILIINKVLYVNGKEFLKPKGLNFIKPFVEPKEKVNPGIFPRGAPWNEDNYGPLYVPKEGELLVFLKITTTVGYSREGYKIEMKPDSKVYIDGNQTEQYKVQRSYYFAMGDNRDNSQDSRYWGFVPREYIVGRAWFVYWSWDSNIDFANFFRLLGSTRLDRIGKSIE